MIHPFCTNRFKSAFVMPRDICAPSARSRWLESGESVSVCCTEYRTSVSDESVMFRIKSGDNRYRERIYAAAETCWPSLRVGVQTLNSIPPERTESNRL